MNKLYLIFTFIIIFSFLSCSSQKDMDKSKNKMKNITTEKGTSIVTAPIVTKKFIKKNGEPSDFAEYYLQRSVDDFFIKFCESQITLAQLKEALDKIESPIKTLTLEVEFKTGSWDICDDIEAQSRIGDYVIIHRIIDK